MIVNYDRKTFIVQATGLKILGVPIVVMVSRCIFHEKIYVRSFMNNNRSVVNFIFNLINALLK